MFSKLDLPALIGRSFFFARFMQTEGGIYVEPFTRLRLESHGRVFGDTPMHWSPRNGGFVLFRHGELPGISFQRAFRGMPVAYHNIEGFFPHNVCLVPEVPASWNCGIYLVASNARFFAQTSSRSLRSLHHRLISISPPGCETLARDFVNTPATKWVAVLILILIVILLLIPVRVGIKITSKFMIKTGVLPV